MVLLALGRVTAGRAWQEAEAPWIRIHDIIEFAHDEYGISYAENSRETIRKQALHHFRDAALIKDNGMATNSPNYRYALTDEMLELIRSYDTDAWTANLQLFQEKNSSLKAMYGQTMRKRQVPVEINHEHYLLSTGLHNQLQRAIVEDFRAYFTPTAICLYMGDTTDKDLVRLDSRLQELGISMTQHDKLPDVVLYEAERHWLFLIEAVTSVGPMSPMRVRELNELTKHVTAGKIFVTAFLDFKTFRKFSSSLAWETEVWIAECPDHMIHLDGDRFLGPKS